MAILIIDGVEHEFSADFDIGEARVIKRYTGLSLAQMEGHDVSDPDLIAAFIHIVFRREDGTLSFSELESRVDAIKLASVDMRDEDEVQLSPPDQSKPKENVVSAGETGEPSNGLPAQSLETESPATTGPPV